MELIAEVWHQIAVRPMINLLVFLYWLLFSSFTIAIVAFALIVQEIFVPVRINRIRLRQAAAALWVPPARITTTPGGSRVYSYAKSQWVTLPVRSNRAKERNGRKPQQKDRPSLKRYLSGMSLNPAGIHPVNWLLSSSSELTLSRAMVLTPFHSLIGVSLSHLLLLAQLSPSVAL